MKLHIIDEADPSVGLGQEEWVIDCPFELEDVSIEDMLSFRNDALALYEDWAVGNLIAFFDYEIPEP